VPDSFSIADYSIVGFDLDLTLIDTRQAFRVALESLVRTRGHALPVSEVLERVGLPLDEMFRPWLDPGQLADAIADLRVSFMTEGLAHLTAMDGAIRLTESIRSRGGRVIIVTSRSSTVATRFLATCGFSADALEGAVTGAQKSGPLRSHGVEVYVGDHPLDMLAARGAGAMAVGVATGAHPARALTDAGAHVVVSNLLELTSPT